ncbi:MAG: YwaF family protein [Clostridia bacterium]|nr:YwaF family protein [Clostridia bacterium]
MPEVFGWQHLTYLAIYVIVGAAAIVLIKKFCKSERSLFWAIKITALILLALIIWNRIGLYMVYEDAIYLIPNTFCGITSFTFAVCALAFKRDNCTLHCMAYCGFLGGLLTMIYPDFIGQSDTIFYHLTMSGLLHHTFALFLSILMFATKWITPSLKKWKYLPIGLSFMMTYGIFILTFFDKLGTGYDAMYITEPVLEGTIFTWYFVGFLFLLLHIIFLLCYTYIPKYINKRKTKSA